MTANVRVTYDLRTQPWSLGDLLTLLAVAVQKFGRFDLVLLHDPASRPTDWEFIPREPGRYLTLLQEVAESIEGCDSVVVSGEPGDWPQDTSQYLCYWLFDELSGGEWPRLGCKPQYVEWAREFVEERRIEGVCHVRRHSHHDSERDSFTPAWDAFFAKLDCNVALIGDVPGLARKNVVLPLVKVGYQLALIQQADWYMGASSGPCTMRMFGSGPYRVFNDIATKAKQFDGTRFLFGPDNKWFRGPETAALLTDQLQELRQMVTA